jgi:uncharacterized protein
MEVLCPNCKKPARYEGNPYRPFCSKRCQLIDLGAWANEEYRVSSKEGEPSTSEGEEKDSDQGEEAGNKDF